MDLPFSVVCLRKYLTLIPIEFLRVSLLYLSISAPDLGALLVLFSRGRLTVMSVGAANVAANLR